MIITNKTHKALSLIALALVVAMLIEITISAAEQRSSNQPVAANPGAAPASQTASQPRDAFDGGERGASGRLLWLRTHKAQPATCIHLSHAQQSLTLDQLEPFLIVDTNVRPLGGQSVARLIAVKLGTAATC